MLAHAQLSETDARRLELDGGTLGWSTLLHLASRHTKTEPDKQRKSGSHRRGADAAVGARSTRSLDGGGEGSKTEENFTPRRPQTDL